MDITKLTQDSKDAILNVDSLLRIAGLPTYTELAESRQRIADSADRTHRMHVRNEELLKSLLSKSLVYLDTDQSDRARSILVDLLK